MVAQTYWGGEHGRGIAEETMRNRNAINAPEHCLRTIGCPLEHRGARVAQRVTVGELVSPRIMHGKRLKAIPFRLHGTQLMEGPYVLARGVEVRKDGVVIC